MPLLCLATVERQLDAQGTSAAGVGARLTIALRDSVLLDETLDGDRELEVPVGGPGWVTIAFTNDLFLPPADRNLRLEEITLLPAVAQ